MSLATKANPFEQLGRATKVAQLVAVLDNVLGDRSPAEALCAVETASEALWAVATRCAGVNPPSPEARALVVEHYRRQVARAEAQRLARNYLASVCPGLVAA